MDRKLFEHINEDINDKLPKRRRSKYCLSYRIDVETCKTGCSKIKVEKDSFCPYYTNYTVKKDSFGANKVVYNQEECPCYR